MNKIALKQILGELPFTAEAYWLWRQPGKPLNKRFTLEQLDAILPEWSAQAEKSTGRFPEGKRVLIFATIHYWISHATMIGLALAGLGHRVTLAYLPYGKWQKPLNRFDLRRQNRYARGVFEKAAPILQAVSLLDVKPSTDRLPPELGELIREVSWRDTQYTLQVEQVSEDDELYRLRQERNTQAALAAFSWLGANRPEVVIVPNGSILEFGAVYRTARYWQENSLPLSLVTYEFGEQRRRIWIAQDDEVMRQQTGDLWHARGGRALSESQLERVRTLFAARQKASLWENFARRWQGVPSAGGEQVRASLGLDSRPVVLLATNVIGDSLTLGRQVFSDTMTEWLQRTVLYFAGQSQAQLVVRIHPGELITQGPSVADVVRATLPELPENIHLVSANAQVNTYDLVEIADLGLVYTTTVGLEMAMSGVPVMVVGRTHYREKGFTLDPGTWDVYFAGLDRVLEAPEKFRLDREQVDRAWEYAYRFFFEYPHPFPWHVVHLWEDAAERPLAHVLDEAGLAQYKSTFDYLAGEPVDWNAIPEGAE